MQEGVEIKEAEKAPRNFSLLETKSNFSLLETKSVLHTHERLAQGGGG